MFKKYQHIHFVGIGGIGMSGIAEVLLNLKYRVSGSDLKPSATTRRLRRRGAIVHYGHAARNIDDAHVVVISSAVAQDNPEVIAARQSGVPVVPRAEMLAELMRLKYGIAVAGTHGKTTTTSLIAHVMAKTGLDPTIVIGGRVKAWRTNARVGRGEFLVAEADESDRSFLRLDPTIAVVTNIDPEHMENYRDFDHVRQSYTDFADRVPFYGSVVGCLDHPEVRALLHRLERRVVSYGFAADAEFTARDVRQVGDRLEFTVYRRGRVLGRSVLRMAGRHNVTNALAAIAVATELDVPFRKVAKALSTFGGIERRFEILSRRGPLVVNDYAHHPAELAAVIQAARDGWGDRRLVVVHQPHRYTRLQALFADFVNVLGRADVAILMRLYEASERPIPGVSARKLWGTLRRKHPTKTILYAETPATIAELVRDVARKNDVVLFLGAGDIWKVAKAFVKSSG